MKKLPKQLFVKIDGDKPDEFYNTADKAEHLVEMGQTVQIGRYELVELGDAVGIAQFVPPKPRGASGNQ
jgi:hypothetical protein